MVDAHTPPVWRVALAFLLAPAAAALVCACLMPLYDGRLHFADRVWGSFLIYLLFGGYPATIFLGLPAFFALKIRFRPTPFNCGLVGAVIAGAPWLFLGLLSSPKEAYSNGHVTHANGVITLAGLLDLAAFTGLIACLGAFAGIVFWAVAASGLRRRPSSAS